MSGDIGKLNSEWTAKFAKSGHYDLHVITALMALDWNVIILWECEIYRNVYEQAERIVRAQYLHNSALESSFK